MTTQLAELTVGDVMSVEPVTVEVSATIQEAQQLLQANRITGLPVVDEHGWLIGVLSQSDLVWGPGTHVSVLLHRQPSGLRVGELMTCPPVTVGIETSVAEAARLMVRMRVHRLVAIDDHGRPVGVLSATDYVSLAAES